MRIMPLNYSSLITPGISNFLFQSSFSAITEEQFDIHETAIQNLLEVTTYFLQPDRVLHYSFHLGHAVQK
jgi:hypothetical protein